MWPFRPTELFRVNQLLRFVIASTVFLVPAFTASRCNGQRVDPGENASSSAIHVSEVGDTLRVEWESGSGTRTRIRFGLQDDQSLIESVSVTDSDGRSRQIVGGLNPIVHVRVGDRDLEKRRGWTIFFDRMQEKPSELFAATLSDRAVSVSSSRRRATVSVGDVSAGPFQGHLRFTFFDGVPFFLQEAVLSTDRAQTAFLYDMGLTFEALPESLTYRHGNEIHIESPASIRKARNFAVQGRCAAATSVNGSLAVFPPPHRYFYPLDFSDNLSNIWAGPNHNGLTSSFGFGIRHDPSGDNRFVPWFNAPRGTRQEMGMFVLVTPAVDAASVFDQVARLTRHDRFQDVPGYIKFASHFHVEHTREIKRSQPQDSESASAGSISARLPSGRAYTVPPRLVRPGFVSTLRGLGVDVVHLAEFHFGVTPRLSAAERVENLEILHAECQRLSDDTFLLLPGEEPNVHLGGHWISLFPEPVYWSLNRPDSEPFASSNSRLGQVYQVGSAAEVHRLLTERRGLAWTAHPRIKSSTGFPDRYRREIFYQSDRFLGAAWKAMPADLSQPRLGSRVLDLLDDMSNWGTPKYVLGEVDVFKIEPDHELYAHMNVNYLRLDEVPKYEDGWQPILDALRSGSFFVTTGEILIRDCLVNGVRSGESSQLPEDGRIQIELTADWTFPLSYVEIVSGDGNIVHRQRVDLSHTSAYGSHRFTWPADVANCRWVRLEMWDAATNGAFTQPFWFDAR